ncbi:hypothetical protein EXIGLDRAFT_831559 [Exidia glandulosa HHB12029]|uniref:DUF6593 domain-containing protein n=1 Tax=Exidia glandulosa HHB12029 TaxID=1314781 RepID=A0A165MFV2_EXIGL|nr:hypothetical protein EXIGLDRAFT_831559 [Exidia glandulosa HHB12029]
MDLTVIPRRESRTRDVCSSTLRNSKDQPLVFYELVESPGWFSVESITVQRKRDPITRHRERGSSSISSMASIGNEDWNRPNGVVVRWGILRATTLNYLGGKERLPERLGTYLAKADKGGHWIREFTGEDKVRYQWRLENGSDLRLYQRSSKKLVATYERGDRPLPNARPGRFTTKLPQLHITELGMPIVDQIVLTWAILEPTSKARGTSLLQMLRGV